MTNALGVKSVTKTAMFVALMSGSSYVAAQDIAPPAIPEPEAAVQPAAPAPITPPPIVRTLPNSNDVVNPAAAQQVAEEQQAKAATAPAAAQRATARAQTSRATASEAAVPAPASVEAAAAEPVAAPSTFNEPSNVPPSGTVTDGVGAADSIDIVPEANAVDGSTDDLPLFAGIAALLAALGLGGLAVARRRTAPVTRHPVVEDRHVAPAAIVPATSAAIEPAAPAHAEPAYATPAYAEPALRSQHSAEPARERPHVNTRPDVPVTDPLFSRKVVPGPITDPMFAPRNDVQTPITDPLFAKRPDFAGRLRDAKPAPSPTPEPVK